jgi:hypothetical protein
MSRQRLLIHGGHVCCARCRLEFDNVFAFAFHTTSVRCEVGREVLETRAAGLEYVDDDVPYLGVLRRAAGLRAEMRRREVRAGTFAQPARAIEGPVVPAWMAEMLRHLASLEEKPRQSYGMIELVKMVIAAASVDEEFRAATLSMLRLLRARDKDDHPLAGLILDLAGRAMRAAPLLVGDPERGILSERGLLDLLWEAKCYG